MLYNENYYKSAKWLRSQGLEPDSDDPNCWRNPNNPSIPAQFIDEDGEIEIDM